MKQAIKHTLIEPIQRRILTPPKKKCIRGNSFYGPRKGFKGLQPKSGHRPPCHFPPILFLEIISETIRPGRRGSCPPRLPLSGHDWHLLAGTTSFLSSRELSIRRIDNERNHFSTR